MDNSDPTKQIERGFNALLPWRYLFENASTSFKINFFLDMFFLVALLIVSAILVASAKSLDPPGGRGYAFLFIFVSCISYVIFLIYCTRYHLKRLMPREDN